METEIGRCVVGYKTGYLSGNMCYGRAFDTLDECCKTFRRKFFETGNKKSKIFGDGCFFNYEGNGLDFVSRGGGMLVLLNGELFNFCPWCGSRIEVKETRNVKLIPKIKEIQDGFLEEPLVDCSSLS